MTLCLSLNQSIDGILIKLQTIDNFFLKPLPGAWSSIHLKQYLRIADPALSSRGTAPKNNQTKRTSEEEGAVAPNSKVP